MKELHPLIYVAGHYSSDPVKCTEHAERASIRLIRAGFDVFTPHKNTFGYEKYEDDTIDYHVWMRMDINILRRCDGIYMLRDWFSSSGARQEYAFATEHGIPVFFEDRPIDVISKHYTETLISNGTQL